jgi:cytochrome c oxidase subunit II
VLTGAAAIGRLADAMYVLGAVVFVLFCLALGYALLHRRRSGPPAPGADERPAARAVVVFGAVLPALVLLPILAWTIHTVNALDPRSRRSDLVVDVVGRQWWWQLRYRDPDSANGFVTANELYIPVGRRVELRLTSSDVIHSFWVPALQGKTDLIPGRENVTWIEAARPGRYGGRCAEYCGTQHAKMGLVVVAVSPADYAVWAARQRRPAAEPTDSRARLGREVFLRSPCATCHAIRGTPAAGALGPDLTHLGSRGSIAAGTLPNTPGYLAGWIADPQALKPGTRMPRVPLRPEDLHRLGRYLATLE